MRLPFALLGTDEKNQFWLGRKTKVWGKKAKYPLLRSIQLDGILSLSADSGGRIHRLSGDRFQPLDLEIFIFYSKRIVLLEIWLSMHGRVSFLLRLSCAGRNSNNL